MHRNQFKDLSKPKNSTVYTPPVITDYLYNLLKPLKPKYIFDPCIGEGALTNIWKKNSKCKIVSCDIDFDYKNKVNGKIVLGQKRGISDYHTDRIFEDITAEEWKSYNLPKPDLILCNPPFNNAPKRRLYPEVFLRKIVELFGNRIPIVIFVTHGFRLDMTKDNSKRRDWLLESGLELSSIIALPRNIFPNVLMQSEILIYNVKQLKPHYFLGEIPMAKTITLNGVDYVEAGQKQVDVRALAKLLTKATKLEDTVSDLVAELTTLSQVKHKAKSAVSAVIKTNKPPAKGTLPHNVATIVLAAKSISKTDIIGALLKKKQIKDDGAGAVYNALKKSYFAIDGKMVSTSLKKADIDNAPAKSAKQKAAVGKAKATKKKTTKKK